MRRVDSPVPPPAAAARAGRPERPERPDGWSFGALLPDLAAFAGAMLSAVLAAVLLASLHG